jgi:uncharacterized protein YegL
MMTFQMALRRHAMLTDALEETGASEQLGQQFWDALTNSRADTAPAIAVEDTTPNEYSVLLCVEDIPAAFAVACQLRAFGPNPPTAPHACRELARKGWEEFRKIADAAGDRQRGTGCDLAASWPLFKAFDGDLDEQAQERLRQVSDLAGRMLVALKGAIAKRVINVPEEVVGVKLGNQFDQLAPSEYARLAHPVLRTELIGRVIRHRATVIEREGTEQKAHGPMVFLIDSSGSMEGQRDTWAKAVMTALTRLAWQDKRDCAAVHFSTATKVHVLKVGDHKSLVRAQSLFLDGGTAMGTAIRVGCETVQELAREGISGADLVLISDGQVPDQQVEGPIAQMERQGIRLHTVAIGTTFRSDSPLRTRAAIYQEIGDGDANNANTATELVSAL